MTRPRVKATNHENIYIAQIMRTGGQMCENNLQKLNKFSPYHIVKETQTF